MLHPMSKSKLEVWVEAQCLVTSISAEGDFMAEAT